MAALLLLLVSAVAFVAVAGMVVGDPPTFPAGTATSPGVGALTPPGDTSRPSPAARSTASVTDGPRTPTSPEPSVSPSTDIKEPPPTSAPPEELTGYQWPLRDARITSRYGPRDFGGFVLVDGEEIHDGLDLATYCGNKIRAAHDGTVLYAGRRFDDYMGYLGSGSAVYERLERRGRMNTLPIVVVIDDGNGYRSVYVHLSEARVEAGETVSAGDVIGLEGATGYATGCHLHYSLIRMDGPWEVVVPQLHPYGYPAFVRQRIDPLDVLPHDDEHAPVRLRNRSATPSPAVSPTVLESPSPSPLSP